MHQTRLNILKLVGPVSIVVLWADLREGRSPEVLFVWWMTCDDNDQWPVFGGQGPKKEIRLAPILLIKQQSRFLSCKGSRQAQFSCDSIRSHQLSTLDWGGGYITLQGDWLLGYFFCFFLFWQNNACLCMLLCSLAFPSPSLQNSVLWLYDWHVGHVVCWNALSSITISRRRARPWCTMIVRKCGARPSYPWRDIPVGKRLVDVLCVCMCVYVCVFV